MEDLKVITIPLTTRGRDRGGRYYWEVIAQGKKIGSWGFSRFPYCPLVEGELRCSDIEKICGPFNCCTSCHEDEYHYGDQYMIEMYLGDRLEKIVIACCIGAEKLQEEIKCSGDS